ncbi:class I SAM-dependent methyltransferase [Chamaesiphon sp.]|uniref:class I SAM-dependent methyltransferase n=1 Tax=Chamaesiphon sp. TaxID=2814140 RepID=UPI0035931FCB
MSNSEASINWYQTFTPESHQRHNWYNAVAATYDRVRPKYSVQLLDRVVEVAKIPGNGKILEVGCGPGTATISLAQRGFSVVALEPSVEASEIARQQTAVYPHVEIINSNFEEWEPADRSFDAIIAATSWHWVAPADKHLKAASLLKAGGKLILLWNTGMQPPIDIFDNLAEVFERYLPTFATYKEPETQLSEVSTIARSAIDSGLFTDLHQEYRAIEVNYSIDDYLGLLTTYSPCIALSPADRSELLARLRIVLSQNDDRQIPLSYLAVFQIATKINH